MTRPELLQLSPRCQRVPRSGGPGTHVHQRHAPRRKGTQGRLQRSSKGHASPWTSVGVGERLSDRRSHRVL